MWLVRQFGLDLQHVVTAFKPCKCKHFAGMNYSYFYLLIICSTSPKLTSTSKLQMVPYTSNRCTQHHYLAWSYQMQDCCTYYAIMRAIPVAHGNFLAPVCCFSVCCCIRMARNTLMCMLGLIKYRTEAGFKRFSFINWSIGRTREWINHHNHMLGRSREVARKSMSTFVLQFHLNQIQEAAFRNRNATKHKH